MKSRESQSFVHKEVATWYVEATSSLSTRNEKPWVRGSDWATELEALGRGLGQRFWAEASHRGDTFRRIGPRGRGGALDVGVSPGVCSLGI